MKEPPITFLPGVGLLTPKLFAKVFTNERMGIETSRFMRIFAGEESRLRNLAKTVRHSVGLKSINDCVSSGIAGVFQQSSNCLFVGRSIKEA